MTRLFVEQLTVIDCTYLDAQRGLVGESWIVDLELTGALDQQGMIFDFGDVKKKLKKVLEDAADHKLIVPNGSELLKLAVSGDSTGLTFKADNGNIEHQAPSSALCVLDSDAVTDAALAAHLNNVLRNAVPKNVTHAEVHLRNEAITGPFYHYTHGLKKHAGHCQRIAHGHRSRLQIFMNGKRDERQERTWADRWRDIYLGTSADVVAHGKGRIRFAYRSSEGEFELELPADRCDLLATDSTVELIAEHIAARVAEERPRMKIEVRAYEGVMKGAIATAG